MNLRDKRGKRWDVWHVGMPGGLMCGLVKHTAVQQGSKTSGQSVERDLFRKQVWGKVNIIQSSGNFGMVSQFCVCEASYSSCVEAGIFRPLLRVFNPSLRVFSMHRGINMEGKREGRPREKKRERETDGRDEWIAEEAVVKRPLTPASPSSEVSSGFVFQMSTLAGGVHSTINKPWPQRNPEGPPAATGGRAEQTQSQVKAPAPTPGRLETDSEGGDGEGGERDAEREKWNRMVRKVCMCVISVHKVVEIGQRTREVQPV